MTLHHPETDAAPTTYTPPPAAEPADFSAASVRSEETIVPVYARKPPKRSPKKALLWAVPAALALGVAALALTVGSQSGKEADPAGAAGLTTSRLSSTTTEAPAAEPLAVQSTPTPGAVAAPAAPSLRPAAAPARVTTTTTTTRRASTPVRRTTTTRSSAPAPVKAAPLPQETMAPVIIETTPPASVAPTPVLPTEPQPVVTPPATETPPGPGGQ